MLAGARVRPANGREIEFVLPNTSGSRGVYVMPWRGVRTFCQPTVHDTMLVRRLASLAAVSPASVRDAGLHVALEGYAGRAAMAAARTVMDHDLRRQRLTHGLLLRALAAQAGPGGEPATPAAGSAGCPGLAMSYDCAPPSGLSPAGLDAVLAALAAAVAPAGIAPADNDARMVRLIGLLDRTRIALADWLHGAPDSEAGGLGETVIAAVDRAGESGRAALAAIRPTMADPAALLRRWIAGRTAVQASLQRCDWLLDGWERPALLFLSAGPGAGRHAALLEMATLIPVLPAEVSAWTDIPVHPDTLRQTCQITISDDSWRTGGPAFGLIARNESLLAMRI